MLARVEKTRLAGKLRLSISKGRRMEGGRGLGMANKEGGNEKEPPRTVW